jgi:excisionase family DNA binding protein
MDRKQAAEYLGISIPTLARWASTGNGPTYYKLGRKVRYNPTDLDQFISSRRRNGGA